MNIETFPKKHRVHVHLVGGTVSSATCSSVVLDMAMGTLTLSGFPDGGSRVYFLANITHYSDTPEA